MKPEQTKPVNDRSIREVALAAWDTGLCLVPPRQDGSKAPIGEWRKYQRERPTRKQIESWYGPNTGLGLVCGEISGNLECLEFDDPTVYRSFLELAQTTKLDHLLDRIETGYLERSPSDGIHWLYRSSAIGGNVKLARRPKKAEEMVHPEDRVKTLIEIRGEGGYIIIAPSHGTIHPSGKPYVLLQGSLKTVREITREERQALFDLARSFDQMPRTRIDFPGLDNSRSSGSRPGDLFNSRETWPNVLNPHGWTLVYQRDGESYWRRPGKHKGISASTNFHESNLLYVFSTSTVFEPERGYSKFSAYASLTHDGDFKAAAQALSQKGYGSPRPLLLQGHHRPRPITTWEVRG
jgi:putative DNA primase/helicase